MKKLVAFLFMAAVGVVLAVHASAVVAVNPYAHYDASNVGSITLGTPPNFVPAPYTQAVTGWADQSANGFNATAPLLGGGGQRDMVYPGPAGHTFTSGIIGIDSGDAGGNGTALSLLGTGAPQDNLLDFTGGASGNSGFSVYMVYHSDATAGNFDYLMGSSAFPNNTSGLGIWLNSTGYVWADVAGTGGSGVFAGYVQPGNETVISFNYDASSGNWTIANTGAGAGSGTGNTAAGNFAGPNFLGLGGSTQWANFRADGDFGEVILYDRFIDPASAEHADTVAALTQKWLIPEPGSLALIGLGLGLVSLARRKK